MYLMLTMGLLLDYGSAPYVGVAPNNHVLEFFGHSLTHSC